MNTSNEAQSHGPVGQGDYVVKQGDCMSSIAYEHGFFWETLWNLPENEKLKEIRKNPNVLFPGDSLTVPPLREKQVSGETEKRYRFRLKGVPAKLRFQLLRFGKPRAGIKYWFRLSDEVTITKGRTDDTGFLEVSIPPGARSGMLTVKENVATEKYAIRLGFLDPCSAVSGLQARLRNLGYNCPQHGRFDEATKALLTKFQGAHGLESSGNFDDATRAKLLEIHGS